MAISILILSQKFTSLRERKQLLIEKIEEISKLITAFDKGTRGFLFGSDKNASENISNTIEALDEMEMLLNLYFSNDVFVKRTKIHDQILELKNAILAVEDKIEMMLQIEKTRIEHSNHVLLLRKECQKLMGKHGHKIT